ncbi:MAG: hypothetical protein ACXWNK_13180 [Vulcanimicrobiaceae bacterium]
MIVRVHAEFPKQTLHHDEERRAVQTTVRNYPTGLFQGWGPKL